MTCIVALVQDGTAYFAGDAFVGNVPSQYHSNVSQIIRKEPKVWARDGMLFGANGSVRMLQLLRYVLEIPKYPEGKDKIQYLVQQFIPALQKCFDKNKYHDEELGGGILLSLGGELFTIGDGFNVCDTADGYDSVGKASEVAIGSLHTTEQLGLSPLKRLYLALEAAEHHTCVVSKPFTYISSGMSEAEILPELVEIV
jgi:hypothetical protein